MTASSIPKLVAAGAMALLTHSAALAQQSFYRPGYVVLAAAPADTVRGEVDLFKADRAQPEVHFRTAAAADVRVYGLGDLLAAGDDSGLHVRRCTVPRGEANVPALLQVMVAGRASLYLDPTGKLPATYYLDKPGVAPMPLKPGQFAQVLQTSFADCPTVNTQVAYAGKYVYSAESLRRYVVNYNRCVFPTAPVRVQPLAPKQTVSRHDRNRERIRLGMQLGAAQVYMYYPFTSQKKAVAGPVTPTFGVLLTLPLSNYFGFVTGITHSSFRSDNTIERPLDGMTHIRATRYQTEGSLLRWPLTARVTLRRPESSWRPYAQGGIQMSYLLNAQMFRKTYYVDKDPESSLDSANGLGRGLFAETGMLFHCGSAQLGAGARFESTSGFPVRGRAFLTNFRQVSLGLTYYH
ncbi:hypothetical protein [Hymenobacter coalescens]